MKSERLQQVNFGLNVTADVKDRLLFTVLCGKSARPFTDPKAILKWVKWPKGTQLVMLYANGWRRFEQKKPQAPQPELDMAKIKAEGFGPEAHDDDPTANTKMVTIQGSLNGTALAVLLGSSGIHPVQASSADQELSSLTSTRFHVIPRERWNAGRAPRQSIALLQAATKRRRTSRRNSFCMAEQERKTPPYSARIRRLLLSCEKTSEL